MSRAPFTLDFNKMGLQSLQLLDPNDPDLTGPIARKREYRTLVHGAAAAGDQQNVAKAHSPLLDGWSEHALKHRLIRPDVSVEGWEQARWDAADERFLRRLRGCTAPEDVDDVLPLKWKAHRTDVESDPRLARVTRLCTTVVNQVVDWTSGNAAWAPKSVTDWHRCQELDERIQRMLEMLESTLGESVGVAALKDKAFIKRCWRAMSEEDHSSFEDSLEHLMMAATNNNSAAHSQQAANSAPASNRSSVASARRPQQQPQQQQPSQAERYAAAQRQYMMQQQQQQRRFV